VVLVFGGFGLALVLVLGLVAGGHGFVGGFVVGSGGAVGVSEGRVVVVEAALFLGRALVWFAGVAAVEMRSRLGRMKRATRWKARG
jgi:hypothetical protein